MNEKIAPVLKKNRVEILDVIRGFAIFGIIIANINLGVVISLFPLKF